MQSQDAQTKAAYRATLLRLNARAWGMAVGLVAGIGLLAATLVLLIQGGPNVGAHLALLGHLLPGYRVTVAGAFIGFAYMFVIGYAVGRIIGSAYNALARGD